MQLLTHRWGIQMCDCCRMSWHLEVTGLGMSQVLRWYWQALLSNVRGAAEIVLKMRFQVKSRASLRDLNVFLVGAFGARKVACHIHR